MKVLFVSAVLPYPLYSGGQIRIYNLLKRLSKKHEIHLYAFIRNDKEKSYLPKLSFCKNVVTVGRGHAWQPKYLWKTLTSSYPFLWNTYHNSEMLSLLSDEVAKGKYDLIHLEPGYVWPSIPTEHKVPIVIAEHNIEHEVYAAYTKQFSIAPLRPFMSLDVAKMAMWEKRSWKTARYITAVYEGDQRKISTVVDPKKVIVVKNGVDLSSFPYLPKNNISSKKLTFIYVGNFLWMENRDAVEHLIKGIWPEIIKAYPGARLRIVGKNLPPDLHTIEKSSTVEFFEHVDVIQKEYQNADIMIAPIRIGGGTKYKLIEAMACGLPVITTRMGAQGLENAISTGILVADSKDEMFASIKRLLDNDERMSLISKARSIIEKSYSWEAISQQLENVWNKCL